MLKHSTGVLGLQRGYENVVSSATPPPPPYRHGPHETFLEFWQGPIITL